MKDWEIQHLYNAYIRAVSLASRAIIKSDAFAAGVFARNAVSKHRQYHQARLAADRAQGRERFERRAA